MVEGLSERIGIIYAKSGLTQREFARRAGVSFEAFRDWLTWRSAPSALSLAKICATYKVSADYLLFGKEQPKNAGERRSG